MGDFEDKYARHSKNQVIPFFFFVINPAGVWDKNACKIIGQCKRTRKTSTFYKFFYVKKIVVVSYNLALCAFL